MISSAKISVANRSTSVCSRTAQKVLLNERGRRASKGTFAIEFNHSTFLIDDNFFVVFQFTNEIIEKTNTKIDNIKGFFTKIGWKKQGIAQRDVHRSTRRELTELSWNFTDRHGSLWFVLQNSDQIIEEAFHLAAMRQGQYTFVPVTQYLTIISSQQKNRVNRFLLEQRLESPGEGREFSRTHNQQLDSADCISYDNSWRISTVAIDNGSSVVSRDRSLHERRFAMNRSMSSVYPVPLEISLGQSDDGS